MTASMDTSARAKRRKPLDLLRATEQEIVAAFAKEDIVMNLPMLPASLSAAIEINRKLISGAMGVMDAWRYGGDSRLAPLCTPGTHQPDAMVIMTVARRLMSVVVANHEVMAQLFPTKARENDPA